MNPTAPARGVDAVVFDFDGTMLDTETPYFHAWCEAYTEHGLELTIEEWATCLGTHGGFDPVEDLTAKGAAFDETELLTRIRARKDELTDVDTLLPGIRDWINEAAELGLAIAVASSSSHDWVNGHLTRLALADRFGHISCRREGVPAKPEPDLYLRACDALGVDPRRALAVEDSPNGVLAAKAAGMYCIAVPHELTASLDLAAADLVLPSLAGRPLQRVIADLTSNRA
ncbi:MAG TPA: HAD family hydrolase [Acidimicrobiales bacterium]|nr:HAD family hydrolase [Acidimicrobiales bacterium]